LDCPTCRDLKQLVAKASRDWAFAEQLAEVSGSTPEFVGPTRGKAEAARKEYDLAVQTLATHREQCPDCKAKSANGGTA
jgi:hypothetical protein